MGNMKDRYVRFDWAIKRLLRQKANFGVLEGFLTVFIGEPITILEILENHGEPRIVEDKYNRLDIKVLNTRGEIIIVEIQNIHEMHYLKRKLYGSAQTLTDYTYLEDSLSEIKKIYCISILYFKIDSGTDYIYRGYDRLTALHTGNNLRIQEKERDAIVSRPPSGILCENIIILANDYNNGTADTPIDEWMHYLKDTAITPDSKTPGLAEASGCLKYNSLSQGERYAYRTYIDDIMIDDQAIEAQRIEGRAEGHKLAIAENYMKGREEEHLRSARGMRRHCAGSHCPDYRTYGRGDSIPLNRLTD